MTFHIDPWLLCFLVIFYLAGIIAAFIALFQSRTPQGAAAWVGFLIFCPFLSLPLFIFFGKRRIRNYADFSVLQHYPYDLKAIKEYEKRPGDTVTTFFCNSEHPFLAGHKLKLLINGDNIFPEMLADIERAEDFILIQMFIFRDDALGREFFNCILAKARKGVKVYILCENLNLELSKSTQKKLKEAGVKFGKYNPSKRSLYQTNFRNHKKLLIVDNKVGYWGGVNIGSDYLGLHRNIGPWRDTNIRVEGPGLIVAKSFFAKDWEWSQKSRIDIDWQVPPPAGNSSIFVLNSDPSGDRAINLLQHIEVINQASKRIWIANPYLVPPQSLIDALLIASIRGVEVKILIPGNSDNRLVSCASEVYCEKLLKSGVNIFKYKTGMMHQKVLLSDDDIAIIGSSNFDFRSMYINFENGIMTNDKDFVLDVEKMLERDFANSDQFDSDYFKKKSLYSKLPSKVCNILSPIL